MARSVWFPQARHAELRDEALPPVGAAEVRVRALTSAISHGSEMLVYRGQVPPDLELDLPTLRGSFSFPIKYGYANVGRVVEAGSPAGDLLVGDLVFSLHPHQSEYVLPSALAMRLPPETDPECAVFLANLETAVNVTLDAAPRLGERVLVMGQGVVGLLVARLLRAAGAGLVVTVDGIERRRALSRSFSAADAALAPGPDLPRQVRELTAGQGVDLVVEASGNAAALTAALDSVVFGGTIVVCSWYGTKPVTVPLGGSFHRKRLRLVSSQVGTIDSALQPRWSHERRLEVARRYLKELELGMLISHRFPLDRAAEAYGLVDEHPEATVQVVLTYPCSK